MIRSPLFFLCGPFLLFSILACSRVETINMRPHSFSQIPQTVIWFQIAGLQEEHMALLNFHRLDNREVSSFENSTCVGNFWNYNLYQLRPSATSGFMAQMIGGSNVKMECSDFNRPPIWWVMKQAGHDVDILENGLNDDESLAHWWDCPTFKQYSESLSLYRMAKVPLVAKSITKSQSATGLKSDPQKVPEVTSLTNYFHAQTPINLAKGLYYDKSCQTGSCYSTLTANAKSLYETMTGRGRKFLFIIRDFSYLKAIKEKNIGRAKEILFELEKLHEYFNQEAEQLGGTLVLVTSSEGQVLDFPDEGKHWNDFEKNGQHVTSKRSSLLSVAFASGAGAEKFCGLYSESEVLNRILATPANDKLRFVF